jgi:carbamoyltransferase
MILLGINSAYHESAATLVENGKVIVAVEEERLNRRKHGKPATVANPHQLPSGAIDYCLSTGVSPRDVDAVCFSFDPSTRRRDFRFDPISQKRDWGDPEGEATFLANLEQVPDALSELLGYDIRQMFHWVPHHLAHAASAYYPSGFPESAILVVDGIGECTTGLMASGQGNRIRSLQSIEYPHSIGFLWEKISKFLGFSEYDACKVMGLAAYGDPRPVRPAFDAFVRIEDGGFSIEPTILEFRLSTFDALEGRLGRRRLPHEPIDDRHANIAAALQACTDELLLLLTRQIHQHHPGERLCLAGGVALNCVSNWRIKEEGPYADIFIPSAPHDAGTAIGAALYVYHHDFAGARVDTPPSPYLGPDYSDDDIVASLRAHGFEPRRSACAAREVANLLADGKIVGWFQGRMEFGPRALGNRSLLADPRWSESRERMNQQVKRRETFRPFAPSVLEEKAAEWFDLGRPSAGHDCMLFACPVRPNKAWSIPAVLHTDGTARLQVVGRDQNPRFHALISAFDALTGVPLLLNTSFNDSEPIVCSPSDAVATYLKTNIEALVMGDYVVDSRPL